MQEADDADGSKLISLCEQGKADEVKLLLRQHPFLVSFVDVRGKTPLVAASSVGAFGVVCVLLANGADVGGCTGRGGWTALHAACQRGDPETIKELLGAGASCCSLNDDGNTPLHYAVRKQLPEELLAVMTSRSDVDVRNKTNETPLFIAAWRDNIVAVELLLKCGANAKIANNKGQTPLHAAALFGSGRVCSALLRVSNVLAADHNGQTAADVAAGALAGSLRAAVSEEQRRQRVEGWLKQIGVDERYYDVFVREEFDLQSLALVTDGVLAAMGLPVAVRLTVAHNARLLGEKDKRASLNSSSNTYSARLDSTTSDLEEEITAGEDGVNNQKLRSALVARNVPVLDAAELQLRHIIGSGFFSQVRLAEWHGVLVACKSISEQPNRLKNQLEIFLQEVGIMAKLRHPNVVQFLGVSLQADASVSPLCILTEYMSGGTLHAAIRDNRWRDDMMNRRFFKVSMDVCKGMVYLHNTAGVIHRDLTPKNVLLDSAASAKIADFGVSRLDNPDYLTHPVGALPYVAPEVYLHHRYSFVADVYSFAIIMSEMLTGADACVGMKPREMADLVAHKGFRPALPLPEDEEDWVCVRDLIVVCWQQESGERPSFLEVLHRLENISTSSSDAGYVLEKNDL